MKYNKHNLAIVKIVKKSEIRPEISGVLFHPEYTIATDSFRLLKVSADNEEGNPFFLEMREVKAEITRAKQLTDGIIEIGTSQEEQDAAANYPDTSMVWPKGQPIASMTVNGKYLAEMVALLAKIDDKQGKVVLSFYGDNKPLKLEGYNTSTLQKGEGLLMPIKAF